MPTRIWLANARSGPHQFWNTPKGASTSMNTAQVLARRNPTNSRWALTT